MLFVAWRLKVRGAGHKCKFATAPLHEFIPGSQPVAHQIRVALKVSQKYFNFRESRVTIWNDASVQHEPMIVWQRAAQRHPALAQPILDRHSAPSPQHRHASTLCLVKRGSRAQWHRAAGSIQRRGRQGICTCMPAHRLLMSRGRNSGWLVGMRARKAPPATAALALSRLVYLLRPSRVLLRQLMRNVRPNGPLSVVGLLLQVFRAQCRGTLTFITHRSWSYSPWSPRRWRQYGSVSCTTCELAPAAGGMACSAAHCAGAWA